MWPAPTPLWRPRLPRSSRRGFRPPTRRALARSADLRYHGQSFELTVPVPPGALARERPRRRSRRRSGASTSAPTATARGTRNRSNSSTCAWSRAACDDRDRPAYRSCDPDRAATVAPLRRAAPTSAARWGGWRHPSSARDDVPRDAATRPADRRGIRRHHRCPARRDDPARRGGEPAAGLALGSAAVRPCVRVPVLTHRRTDVLTHRHMERSDEPHARHRPDPVRDLQERAQFDRGRDGADDLSHRLFGGAEEHHGLHGGPM